jgi:hypothetical protein
MRNYLATLIRKNRMMFVRERPSFLGPVVCEDLPSRRSNPLIPTQPVWSCTLPRQSLTSNRVTRHGTLHALNNTGSITIYHALGVAPSSTITNREGRLLRLTKIRRGAVHC